MNRKRRIPISTRHIHANELAAFLEGSLGTFDHARVHSHLRCCSECFDLYQHAIRFRSASEAGEYEPPEQLLVLARQIVAGGGHDGIVEKRPWRISSRLGRVAVAAAVAMIAVSTWITSDSRFSPTDQVLKPVADAVVAASVRQKVVMPGVSEEISEEAIIYRSGYVRISPELDRSLATLAAASQSGDISAREMQWLISGYIATGQLRNAATFIREARDRFPDELNFVTLKALLAFHNDDLMEARDLLMFVLAANPKDTTARYDLAVVLEELGEKEAAALEFDRVEKLDPDSGLARRVRSSQAM